MLFMTLVKSAENQGPPPPTLMTAIAKLGEEAFKNGTMVEMGGLYPSAAGAKVALADGKIIVTDGPFTEAKEVIGGYAVFNLKSKAEAIDQARIFMDLHRQHWPGLGRRVGSPAGFREIASTLTIAAIVFQLRVVAGTPKSRSSVPR
jgi:hypothetical protein